MLSGNLVRAMKSIEEVPFPKAVIVEVCGICNLRCIMCPYPELNRPKGVMEQGMYKKIINEIAMKNKDTQLWLAIMGEPLLFHGIYKYITYAKDKGINEVILNTNGTLLTAKKYQLLRQAGLDKIVIGMDAVTEETYSKIRVGGDFKKLNNTVIDLVKESDKPEITLQFIVMPQNAHEEDTFKKYWLSKGVKLKIRKKLGWGDAVQAEGLDIDPGSNERVPCPWLIRTMSIQWSGKVAQCDADYEGNYSPGNISSDTIQQIWQGKLKERRDKHWAKQFDFAPCNTCRDWQVGLSEYYALTLATIRDMETIFTLWKALINDDTDKNKIASMLNNSRGRHDIVIKLLKDTEVIGFIAFNVKGDSNHISGIAVLPEYRNNGYGTILLKAAEDTSHKEMILEARKDNPVALKFWESAGYHKVSEITGFYPDVEAVVFNKKL